MSSIRPLQWIEQAEARQVMTDAMFRQVPGLTWHKQLHATAVKWLQNLRCQAFPNVAPGWPMLQPQPVLIRRRQRPADRRDDYCER